MTRILDLKISRRQIRRRTIETRNNHHITTQAKKGDTKMSKPIVTIVGRPNVGKSSVFNRIVKRPIAVIHDISGVTRDRIYADVEWKDQVFTLVDTGGLLPSTDDRLIARVRSQIETAISEASLILFVVDVIDGPIGVDFEIADLLRRFDKPVILVVNKVDNLSREYAVPEFYEFGFGEPLGMSAIHNIGIDDVLDEIVFNVPESSDEEIAEDALKIAIVGRPNVGKSSLVNAILGEERVIVDEDPGTTRDAVDIKIQRGPEKFDLVDTAGLRRPSRIKKELEQHSVNRAISSIKRSDIAWLVIDATRKVARQDKRIANYIVSKGSACILVVNKWDLIEKDDSTHNNFLDKIMYQMPFMYYVPILFVSALTGQRVMKLLNLSMEVHREHSMKISTSELNVALKKLTAKHPHPIIKGSRPSMKYITQTDIEPPIFTIFTSHPDKIRSSYKDYLANSFRAEFGFMGAPLWFRFKQK